MLSFEPIPSKDYIHKREQAKKDARDKSPVKKGRCECGRKMMWPRNSGKPAMCSTCKTIGPEEARRTFLQLNMQIAKVS